MIKHLFFALLIAIFAISAFAKYESNDPIMLTAFNLSDNEDQAIASGETISNVNITGGDFTYFYFNATADMNLRHFVVTMTKDDETETSFDPDLFIRVGEKPTRSDSDASDPTTNAVHRVELLRDPADSIIWIGVYGYGTVSGLINIEFNAYNCGGMDCGGDAQGTCAEDTGVCTCKAGFVSADTHCVSTIVENTEFDTEYSGEISSQQYEYVYYKFPAVEIPNQAWFKAVISRPSAQGQIVAMLKFGQLPTLQDNDGIAWAYQSMSDLVLTADAVPAHSSSDWYLGIYLATSVSEPVAYTLGATIGYCANGCSGHGECDSETSTCSCAPHYTIAADCSIFSMPLVTDQALDVDVEAYSHVYYTVPINDDFGEGPVELTVTYAAGEMDQYPQLLMRLGAAPDASNFDMQSSRPATQTQSIHIAAHDLIAGTYTLMIDNPSPAKASGELRLVLTPHCAHGCSDRGTCTMAGVCECPSDTKGGDCGVTPDLCREEFDLPGGGVSPVMTAVAVLLFTAIGGALGVFLFKKYGPGLIAERHAEQANPDRQYNVLN